MTRSVLTTGNQEALNIVLDEFISMILGSGSSQQGQSSARALKDAFHEFSRESIRSGSIEDTQAPIKIDPDESAGIHATNGFDRLILSRLTETLGRYGSDSIATIGAAHFYSSALADRMGATQVYYRGEEQYGWPLLSRVERDANNHAAAQPGLTSLELKHIRRFQSEVVNEANAYDEIFPAGVPEKEDVAWLPAMQHYDTKFGTRLIDLTRSIFAGLYFACVSWNGKINSDIDGILYAFGENTSNFRLSSDEPASDEDWTDCFGPSINTAFQAWEHPDIYRLLKTSTQNPRELAQDGVFLVRPQLGPPSNLGTTFKFRIPAAEKVTIAKELWRAGYTPRRIVRGPAGNQAEMELGRSLGMI